MGPRWWEGASPRLASPSSNTELCSSCPAVLGPHLMGHWGEEADVPGLWEVRGSCSSGLGPGGMGSQPHSVSPSPALCPCWGEGSSFTFGSPGPRLFRPHLLVAEQSLRPVFWNFFLRSNSVRPENFQNPGCCVDTVRDGVHTWSAAWSARLLQVGAADSCSPGSGHPFVQRRWPSLPSSLLGSIRLSKAVGFPGLWSTGNGDGQVGQPVLALPVAERVPAGDTAGQAYPLPSRRNTAGAEAASAGAARPHGLASRWPECALRASSGYLPHLCLPAPLTRHEPGKAAFVPGPMACALPPPM